MSSYILPSLPSLRFLHATLVHKWHVYVAGRRLGVSRWQLLIHDLSKFHPHEFVPYGKFFYAMPGAGWLKAKTDSTMKPVMLTAWRRHIQRNPHHWQNWVIVNGASVVATSGTIVTVEPVEALCMPRHYVREMLADWMGAGRAYQGAFPETVGTWKWWHDNRDQLVLHKFTRIWLTEAICHWFGIDYFGGDDVDIEQRIWGTQA